MPIYRTNSDRGLWKKYREEKPQHFHKACYLPPKNQPQVGNIYLIFTKCAALLITVARLMKEE